MSPRTLACMFGAATALSAQIAVALGLGEIKLNSTLNQPLDAEIRLLQVRDLSEREILIGLASADDFSRVGVDRPFFLSDLQFEVDLSNPQQPVVHITSDKPVREPFLNFVVEAQWPSGRLLREYTLLMDLPVYAQDQQARPVQPAARPSADSQTRRTTRRNRPEEQQTRGEPERQVQPAAGSTYGPVKSSDNLWSIAAAARPDRGVSVQQAMIAIQRANPGAFINDNINLLRQGQVLRIPNREEMTQLSGREAVAEVAYQNQRWTDKAETTAEAPQLEGSRSYSARDAEPSEPEGRIKLSSPQDYADSAEGRGTGDGGGNTEALENELATTLEELDKTKSENAELKSRLESLEAQIETMERLLDVSNEELRAMQLTAQQQQKAADETGAGEEDVPATTAADGAAMEGGSEEHAADEQVAAGEGAVEALEPGATPSEPGQPAEPSVQQEAQTAQPERDPTRVVRSAPKPENNWLDLLKENLVFIGLGLVALLAALALFLRSRKKAKEEDDFDDFLTEPRAEEWEETEEVETAPADDEFVLPEPYDEDTTVVATDAESTEELAEQETEDAVAEAEIYIALAKYDQAEDILLRALESDPRDVEARLKLLELYATQQDVDSFDAHLARLHVLGDEKAITRAEELRGKIVDAPPFDNSRFDTTQFAAVVGAGAGAVAAGAAAHNEESEEDFSFDLDLSALDDETAQETSNVDEEINTSLGGADELNDFDLELDLDNELEEAGEATEAGAVTSDTGESDDDFEFDFELDIDDATEGVGEDAEEVDISDEFAFDLGLDDLDESADSGTLVRENEAIGADVDDVDAVDLDFSSAVEESSLDEERAEDAGDNSIDFEWDEEPRVDQSAAADANHGIDFDLDGLGLDEESEDGVSESSTPETLGSSVEDDLGSADAGSEEDDLKLDGDMDLSALDEELDAMTSDLDAEDFAAEEEMADSAADQEEEPLTEEPTTEFEADEEPLALADAADNAELTEEEEQAEEDLPLMEEPLTDFEDLDDLLGATDETPVPKEVVSEELESEEAESAEAESEEIESEGIESDEAEFKGAETDEATLEEQPEEQLEDSELEAQDLTSGLSMEDEPMEELNIEPEEKVMAESEASVGEEEAPLSEQAEAEDDDLPDYEALMASANADFDLEDIDPESEDDSDLGFLSDSDETATKLDLARAYIDMGDAEGAKDILEEIVQEGNDDQRKEAQQLLERV